MKYYVVQVQTCSEEKFMNLYTKRRVRPKLDIPEEEADNLVPVNFYFPRKKMNIRRQGKQLVEESAIFPGYIFAELDEIMPFPGFMENLRRTREFFRVLPSNTDARPLYGQELDVIGRFLVKNGSAVGLSQVKFNENQRIVVLKGPMMGLEGNIIKVDRRKKRAKIKVLMFSTELTIDLGFEVIGEPT
jgi:transcriptional antiterminator NusG